VAGNPFSGVPQYSRFANRRNDCPWGLNSRPTARPRRPPTFTIPAPAVRFEDAKAGISKLAARVESEKTDAQDVTRRYLDMEARLRNLRAQEAQYLAIMKSAHPAQDLLDVSRKLAKFGAKSSSGRRNSRRCRNRPETVAIPRAGSWRGA